jgi:hypothetical protein
MGTVLMAVGRVVLFILKVIGKLFLTVAALALCAVKIFLMLLIVTGHIVFGIVRLGDAV